MNKFRSNIIMSIIMFMSLNSPIYAESLFKAGISQNVYSAQPKPLFSTVKAKNIGDIVTITINEDVDISDDINFTNTESSTITDNFRAFWNKIIPGTLIPDGLNNFGGGTDVNKRAISTRRMTLRNTITAQVVQILPNRNLLVQGKKVSINAKERVEVVISGIIDPRLIDSFGSIDSNLVANLQVAVVGKGSVSRSSSEGPINKYVRYLY